MGRISRYLRRQKRAFRRARVKADKASASPVSPLAPPTGFPDIPAIAGVTFASVAASVRYKGRDDVMLALLDPGTTVAGLFTRSATRAAPVLDCESKLGGDSSGPAAILVNAGNANAFTGHYGQLSVANLCDAVQKATDVTTSRIFTASTGVIGEPLPHDRIIEKIDDLVAGQSADLIESAARAIMTTDTFPKGSVQSVQMGGKKITIAGFAKGSGMIAPDMATMLVYIFTDAKIGFDELQSLVAEHNGRTFNAITVDSDTSTSDTLLVCATGASGVEVANDDAFSGALSQVMQDLALQVVRDGEGATKLVEITIKGARSGDDAHRAAMAIANSPLVKTAIAGEDPNWGRVVMAIGKSGAEADRDTISIWFGDILVAEKGWVAESYREEDGADYMQRDEIAITVDLAIGAASKTVWTCDLTKRYIEINADYRS